MYVCGILALIAMVVISTSSAMIAGAIHQAPVFFYRAVNKQLAAWDSDSPLDVDVVWECMYLQCFPNTSLPKWVPGTKPPVESNFVYVCVEECISVSVCIIKPHTVPAKKLLDKEKSVIIEIERDENVIVKK